MRHTSRLHPVPASEPTPGFDDLEFELEPQLLVPPGSYEVIVLSCRKLQKFHRDVLLFEFQIVSPGPGFGLTLPTFINAPAGGRKPRTRSKLASWLRVIHAYDPTLTRLHISLFRQYQFQADIKTVTRDREQRPLPDYAQFSKVGELTGVVGRLTA